MRNRVERLRLWLLGSAIFLMLVITGFIGYARFMGRFHHLKLPASLGVNIVRDGEGWTLSRSKGSSTLYTVHAARWDQGTNGKIALHDVSMTLYGAKGDRRDHIYGQDFEYDEKAGLVRAIGVVHLDLQAAGATAGDAAGVPVKPEEAPNPKVLRVTTSSLVYLEKLGVAATNDYIEFQSGTMNGHATGADYSSDSGRLMLHSAVSMGGTAGGQPVALTASTAEFENAVQEAHLTHAKYASGGRTAEAEVATLHTRPDGTLARVEAQGNVTLQAKGATVVSQRADVGLNGASQPQTALLTGGVLYTFDQPLLQRRGDASEATIAFDGQANPQPEHAVFTGGIHMIERTRATEAVKEPWSVRDLTAEKLDAVLARVGKDNAQLRNAEAIGRAHLTLVDNGTLASAAGEGQKEISADDLKVVLRDAADARQPAQVDTIAGRGHTVLRQVSADGVEQTSTGDSLDAKFRPGSARPRPAATGRTGNGIAAGGVASSTGDLGVEELASAVLQGHVIMTRHAPGKKGSGAAGAREDVRRATAERATYDGDLDRLTLTGGVQMTDAAEGSMLWANQVALDRATGDSHAVGAVKVNYDSSRAGPAPGTAIGDGATRGNAGGPGSGKAGSNAVGSAEPTHILADRADMDQAAGVATFYGKPARLWQGGSQVQAPVIEMSSEQKRLIARSDASTGWSAAAQPAQVHTVLVSAASATPGGQAGTAAAATCATATTPPGRGGAGLAIGGTGTGGAAAGEPQAIRIASGGLIYSGILRQADFTGGVRADTLDATIRASQATAYLDQDADAKQPATSTPGSGSGPEAIPSLAGALDRVIVSGHVDIERPGLQATGERLVYTAADRVFLLTGDKNAPPKAMDAQGTTTGAALRLVDTCDDSGGLSVEALGEVPGEPAQRVRTDSRISNEKKKENGRK